MCMYACMYNHACKTWGGLVPTTAKCLQAIPYEGLINGKNCAWDFEIFGFCRRFPDFLKDFKISCKASMQISTKISFKIPRFHARFPCRFQRRFMQERNIQWIFLQDFMIPVQILTDWFWISGWCDYLLHARILILCTGSNLHSLIHYISCMCDTDPMYKQ